MPPRGAKPLPAAIHKAQGTKSRRYGQNSVAGGDDIIDPPDSLSANEQKCFMEIVQSAPEGVLLKSDTIAVELAARVLACIRDDMQVNYLAQMRQLLASFGMLPSERVRLIGNKNEKEENDFEGM